ncbi:MAG TPA: hypothetical protein DDX91_01295 [Ruminococcaceae bacterium]|nr:hypothetical protein [Oscillospiraceae bacterium]
MSEYLSGDQLYKFLHISKRKMKYLLENGYIPVIDTGKKTYKYRVKRCDAEKFKERMEREADFLRELRGRFGSGNSSPKATLNCAIKDNEREEFREFLTKLWSKYPDALPAKKAAELADISPQRVNELVRKGVIYGICVGNVQYLSKEQFIEYITVKCNGGKLAINFKLRNSKPPKST